jgi:hypothetical protein
MEAGWPAMNLFCKVAMHVLVIGMLSACTVSQATPAPVTATSVPKVTGLTDQEVETLLSLKQVDDYPLYTMRYQGDYEAPRTTFLIPEKTKAAPAWACSLFTVLLDEDHLLYGRNFDWEFSPALLLFADPPDGYASVSMVDMAYLGLPSQDVSHLADLPLEQLKGLLHAPGLPFDGMNEHGLAIGMAAVLPANMQADPSKKTIGSLGIIRLVLDHARTVDEAVELIRRYNIDFDGGPPLHYLIADASGKAVLVEFYQGKMRIIGNDQPWHSATNFLLSSVPDPAQGNCWRYDKINARFDETQGRLDSESAMELLSEVTQNNTQWSVVYQMAKKQVSVAMGRDYENVHTFQVAEEWNIGR